MAEATVTATGSFAAEDLPRAPLVADNAGERSGAGADGCVSMRACQSSRPHLVYAGDERVHLIVGGAERGLVLDPHQSQLSAAAGGGEQGAASFVDAVREKREAVVEALVIERVCVRVL